MSATPVRIYEPHRHRTRRIARLLTFALVTCLIAATLAGVVYVAGGQAQEGGAALEAATARGGHALPIPPPPAAAPAKPLPKPAKTPVIVLNGNGISGSATDLARQLQGLGYPVPLIGDAARIGVPTTVMYRPGWGRSARAVARSLGDVRFVTPLDGVAVSELHGAKLVVVAGN